MGRFGGCSLHAIRGPYAGIWPGGFRAARTPRWAVMGGVRGQYGPWRGTPGHGDPSPSGVPGVPPIKGVILGVRNTGSEGGHPLLSGDECRLWCGPEACLVFLARHGFTGRCFSRRLFGTACSSGAALLAGRRSYPEIGTICGAPVQTNWMQTRCPPRQRNVFAHQHQAQVNDWTLPVRGAGQSRPAETVECSDLTRSPLC